MEPFRITTDAVNDQRYFDPRYTCDFDNSSPELRWSEPPAGTTLFALLAEDLDASAPGFAHWVIFNIPGHIRHLPAGIPPQELLPNGIRQGINSLNKLGYTGPCPPMNDRPHRYVFRLYALREGVEIPARTNRETLLRLIGPVVLATAEISGYYERARKAG